MRDVITVLESFVEGKNPNQPDACEDAVVICDDFVAVIDGATDKTGWRQDGMLGGQIAAETIADTIRLMPPGISALEAAKLMNQALGGKVEGAPEDGPSASVCIYSRHRGEIWRIGDVNWHLPDTQRTAVDRKWVDLTASNMRAAIIGAAQASGASIEEIQVGDPGREAILPLLRSQYLFRNREDSEWGFGAIDGTTTPRTYIQVTPLNNGDRTVILASDGYQDIQPTLAQTEALLAQQLAQDPLCVAELRGTKGVAPGNTSFDDRAYVRFVVS